MRLNYQMFKYTTLAKRNVGYITPTQVEHVLEYGKIVSHPVRTCGGSLRRCTPRKKSSVMKKFEFDEETVYVRYKHSDDYIIIIDITIKAHVKKKSDGQSRTSEILYKCHSSE